MKFDNLRTKRAHSYGNPDKASCATLESFPKPTAAPHQIHTYVELRQQIHDDLRLQHPEWVQADGTSPMCDSYEARLLKLLPCDVKAQTEPGSSTYLKTCKAALIFARA